MKKLTFLLSISALLILGCTQPELNKEEASALLKEQGAYPKIINYDIYQSDPQHAKKLMDAGLVEAGLVEVQQTQKLSEVGSPLVSFTPKAQPYLLATPARDRSTDIQNVKLAEEDVLEITGIKSENGGKETVVEYTTGYKNSTPFAPLAGMDLAAKKPHQAVFTREGEAWKLKK